MTGWGSRCQTYDCIKETSTWAQEHNHISVVGEYSLIAYIDSVFIYILHSVPMNPYRIYVSIFQQVKTSTIDRLLHNFLVLFDLIY